MVDNDQVTSTVEDSQDAAKEASQIEEADNTNITNTEVTSSSPADCNGSSDSTQLSKEKLAKFSFEHKAQ